MNHTHRAFLMFLAAGGILAAGLASARAQSHPTQTQSAGAEPVTVGPELARGSPFRSRLRDRAEAAMRKGLKYLESVQGADGSWKAFDKPDPAITAIVAQAFAQDPNYGPKSPVVRKALEYVMSIAPQGRRVLYPGPSCWTITTPV